jgi:hypothetical protein
VLHPGTCKFSNTRSPAPPRRGRRRVLPGLDEAPARLRARVDHGFFPSWTRFCRRRRATASQLIPTNTSPCDNPYSRVPEDSCRRPVATIFKRTLMASGFYNFCRPNGDYGKLLFQPDQSLAGSRRHRATNRRQPVDSPSRRGLGFLSGCSPLTASPPATWGRGPARPTARAHWCRHAPSHSRSWPRHCAPSPGGPEHRNRGTPPGRR